MVFSSYVFIFAFLPVVLSVYYALSRLKNGIYQRLFLIAASLFFYGYYNTKYLILITASIAINYGIALAIQTHRAKDRRNGQPYRQQYQDNAKKKPVAVPF